MDRPTLISLFTGAGGLDIGLERAGFCTLAASDVDADCCETLRENQRRRIPLSTGRRRRHLRGTRILRADIARLSRDDLRPDGAGADWCPDLLAGGPPCQPFSSSGLQRSILDDRGRLFEHFVRLAEELSPRFVLFENVRGLVTARGPSGEPGEVLAMVRRAFESIGYATAVAVLNAADHGAPQRRVRLFMVGARHHDLPKLPRPTHGRRPVESLVGGTTPWTTLGDFLRTRPRPADDEIVRPSESLRALLARLPAGSGLKSPGRSEPTRPGGHWGYKQGTFIADQSLPARTVTGASTQDWIRLPDGELRRLTFSECSALQGFPAEWVFCGSKTSRFRQVGNAVPAVFGEVLGAAVRRSLGEGVVGVAPQSRAWPDQVLEAIAYTKRDHARNAASRSRACAFPR